MPQVNVGPNSIVDKFCILNTSSSIDHDCEMKSFSSIAPRVATGATIKHGITVGDDAVIGANSYVNKSVDSNVVAYGSPCKFVRERTKGHSYLS